MVVEIFFTVKSAYLRNSLEKRGKIKKKLTRDIFLTIEKIFRALLIESCRNKEEQHTATALVLANL